MSASWSESVCAIAAGDAGWVWSPASTVAEGGTCRLYAAPSSTMPTALVKRSEGTAWAKQASAVAAILRRLAVTLPLMIG